MTSTSNKGNEAWKKLMLQSEKLYLRCPSSMYQHIERILEGSKYDLLNFGNHSSLVELINESPNTNRPKRIIYHFSNLFYDSGIIETREIIKELNTLIPHVKIIGLYRNNHGVEELLKSNGVTHALEYSINPNSKFETELQKLLF